MRPGGPALQLAEAEGGCHCGAVRFRARLAQGLASAGRCNCSYCRMKGSVSVTVADGGFKLLSGADHLGTYRFNTGVAAHHFCVVCGINTHHARSSVPGQIAVSAACLDGVSPFDFLELPVWDGEGDPAGSGLAGVLRYSPA
jgi:hypothetical protein